MLVVVGVAGRVIGFGFGVKFYPHTHLSIRSKRVSTLR